MAKLWNKDETRPVEETRAKVYIDGKFLGECSLKVNVEWERPGPISTMELFVNTPKEPEVVSPGEGYRLLGPGEKLYPGDEGMNGNEWMLVARNWEDPWQCVQVTACTYRRRNRFRPEDVVICTHDGFDVHDQLGTVFGQGGPIDSLRVTFMTLDGPVTRIVSDNHLVPASTYRAAKYRELLKSYDKVKAEKDKAYQAAASAGTTLQNILSQFKGI